MNEQSLKPVIEKLEKLFSTFNKRLYNDELQIPVITVSPDTTSGAYGWCTSWKAWKKADDKDEDGNEVYLMEDAAIHFVVNKTDLGSGEEVEGAKVSVYKAEDINEDGSIKEGAKALDSWISAKNETHDFGPAVEAGGSYVLVEEAAPAGYIVTTNIAFSIGEDGSVTTEAKKAREKRVEIIQVLCQNSIVYFIGVWSIISFCKVKSGWNTGTSQNITNFLKNCSSYI